MDVRIGECIQEFKNESNRSMMRFIFRDESRLSGYQLEMLKNNRIPMLLRSEILKVDQEIRISYDITSMIPLNKILERKETGRHEFLQYLRQITGVFDQLENHLLDYGGLILDSSMIYGSPADDRIFFVYLPIKGMEQDISESLRQFITNLIIRDMKFRDEDADNYIQRLIEVLKAPDFSLNTLSSWLDNFARGQNHTQPAKAYTQTLDEAAAHVRAQQIITGSGPEQSRQKKPEIEETRISTVTEKRTVYPLSSWLFLGSAIAAIIALFATMAAKGVFEPENPDMLTTIAGMVLIGGAVMWLVCSRAFARERKTEKLVEKKIHGQKGNHARISSAIASSRGKGPKKHMYRKVEYVNKSIPQPETRESRSENSYGISVSDSKPFVERRHGSDENLYGPIEAACAADRTVLLDQKENAMPSIKRLGGDGETVVIRQWPYRIGRMSGQVDYCINNPAIGRIHAELTKGPDGYCITDMNTRNGTYINGTRIEPNTGHPIKSGDRFMLANEEFQFFG